MAARNRDTGLLANMAVAVIQRRGLGDDRLVEHQEDGPDAAVQPIFEPLLLDARCQDAATTGGRRFHRRRNRSIAELMLLVQTSIPWTC